ncbi:ankyrin repeat domain-containing protein [Orientia tsutsugamushi]|uniref:ankyrin repeat domain-containing protein n=1 Tax=Orientia tsutsugamushi TaxID=784 RepID=UPI001CC24B05|nr:ankyrin repeat domain-containing protein [Orientia tsutsugamushi]
MKGSFTINQEDITLNQEDITLVQNIAELIQARQYLQATILLKHRGGFSGDIAVAVTSELYSRTSEELLSEFLDFGENMENCRTSNRYAMLFDDDGFITNEREYCARIAADFSARGRLNRKTVHSIFGGMDVSQAISLVLANPMAYYHDAVLDTLVDYAINTNLRYKHKGDEAAFEAAKMNLCTSFLSMIGGRADYINDQESKKRISCVLKNSSNVNKLLSSNPRTTHILMFNLLSRGCKESAKLLLDSGGLDVIPLPEVPAEWLTLLDAAIDGGNYCCAKLLAQRGVDIVSNHHDNLSSEMKALCNTHQFFKNTGYFKDHKCIPDQMLEDSLRISSFITQDKSLRDSCWTRLKDSVDSQTLLSQMAYEFRRDSSLLAYFMELTQLELSKLHLQSAASKDSTTEHRDKYTASKSSQTTTGRSL